MQLKVKDDFHENMVCRNCGFCCTLSPRLTEADIRRINSLGYFDKFFVHESFDGSKTMKQEDGKCIFLNTNNEKETCCDIYAERPIACRIYPSFDSKIKECPNKGKSWKSSEGNSFLKPVLAFKNS